MLTPLYNPDETLLALDARVRCSNEPMLKFAGLAEKLLRETRASGAPNIEPRWLQV